MYDQAADAKEAGSPPPPRRAKRKRKANFPFPLRIAIVVIAGMAGAFLLFQIMIKVVHPYKLGYEEGRRLAAMQERLEKQQRKNMALRRDIAYLQGSEGREAAARRAHYQRPGEIVYLLPTPAPPSPPPPATP